MDMHKWLYEEGMPSNVGRDILEPYPYKEIKWMLCLPDYNYTTLYRLTPPRLAICACCERLVTTTGTCRFAGLQTAKDTRNKNAGIMDTALRDRMVGYVNEADLETIFDPVNFMNAHWCCLEIKVQAKRIVFYDPLNQGPYENARMEIATHLLNKYDVVAQNNPIQFDGYACGVYVCWMFIRHAYKGLGLDMSATSFPRHRFELFYYLMSNRLLA
ncbi:hypothetical protein PHMEG_00021222 [Phytophthora megakarya]|uniref:Ubiquitin-like protease family profile domain-containing protein n=1 Tax=Phytophthora megakarya TaxID=4795 RepID=A0A225VLW5_9STRA|nr:hypothetical protein PHMEG_00021222 [Phytophthora megakarya]